jgi:glyoxylase I family protein
VLESIGLKGAGGEDAKSQRRAQPMQFELSACSKNERVFDMPSIGSLSHIDISVGYPERSIPFYDALLTALGYRRRNIDDPAWGGENPSRASWIIRNTDGSHFDIEVRPAKVEYRDRRYERYSPGPHHLAFHAQDDAAVDRVHREVQAVGGEVLDAPANYGGQSGYGTHYYAVFFADPDGFKLEVCHVPPEKSEGLDLGFSYRTRKNGDVQVLHHGRLASTLRNSKAGDFLAEVKAGDAPAAQQLMARVTGNYKRGNERVASQHPRNRR